MIPATLTATAAAKYLGISKHVFYRDVAPTLPAVRGLSDFPRYRPVDLDEWVAERTGPPHVSDYATGLGMRMKRSDRVEVDWEAMNDSR